MKEGPLDLEKLEAAKLEFVNGGDWEPGENPPVDFAIACAKAWGWTKEQLMESYASRPDYVAYVEANWDRVEAFGS